ncbi:TlpA family protein disulfide reductase [Arsenicicoccus dermatophilus]|uniref:TlpA family protein disulfide reductase n=1 Tax=Arsenicicoccus dermatophilus TaxID=1076331 RepID=UPI001F4CAF8B|nr:TlpA disulfide reductase family protein [Arsenicicoccus dermatophilus]MCH8613863.1 TlpA family protein disulfide reductase [Arsenicicoccus dermatophilus]
MTAALSFRPTRRSLLAILSAAVVATPLAACSQDPGSINAQARSGDQKGYLSGDGTLERLPVARRKAPVTLKGTTLDGKPWDAARQRGHVVVLNLWASWCPPCVEEQPRLTALWTTLRRTHPDVELLGVHAGRESADNARDFARGHQVPYPTLAYDGQTVLALQGKAPSPPTTLVLDAQGRIAARILGPVASERTVADLITDVVEEGR